jgi:hypothetical protein
MKVEKLLYGVRLGDEDWQEELLTNDETRHEDAKVWAVKEGFDPKRFRVATFDPSSPIEWPKVLNS